MNVETVRLRDFRSWKELDLDLPDGLSAILGRSGAGKSSTLLALDVALFGGLRQHLRTDATSCMAEVTFRYGGERYRVRRSFRSTGRSGISSLDFEQERDGGWEPLTSESQAATEASIRNVLGITRETWRASAYLAQSDTSAFTAATPKGRRAILQEILALGAWETRHQLAREARMRAEAAAEQLDSDVLTLEAQAGQVDDLADGVARARAAEETARAVLAAAEEAAAAAAELAVQHREARGRVKAAEVGLEQAHSTWRTAEAAQQRAAQALEAHQVALPEVEALQAQVAMLPDLEAKLELVDAAEAAWRDAASAWSAAASADREAGERLERYQQTRHEIGLQHDQLGATHERLIADRERAKQPGALCRECDQELNREARAAAIGSMTALLLENEAEQAALEERMQRVDRSIEEQLAIAHAAHEANRAAAASTTTAAEQRGDRTALVAAIAEARGAREALASAFAMAEHTTALEAVLRERVDEAAHAEAQRRAAHATLDAASAAVAELPALPASPEHEVRAARTGVEDAVRRVATIEAALERAREAEPALAEARVKLKAEQQRAGDLLILERAFHPSGVPMMITENAAIPQVEADAGRIAAELGLPVVFELRTQRATQAGGLSETLEIVVQQDGAERPLESYSGGERARLDVSLRIALARLLAHRRGSEVRTLMVDEVEYLDETNHEDLVRVLRGLLGEFDRIVLISHVQALKDAVGQTITIERGEGDVSRVAA